MKISKFFLLFSLSLFLLSSCKKDKNEVEAENTNKDYLTRSGWVCSVLESYDDSGTLTGTYQESWNLVCNQDGTFSSVNHEGNFTGTWHFTNSEHGLLLDVSSGGTRSFDILELNDTHLNLKELFSDGNYGIWKLVH